MFLVAEALTARQVDLVLSHQTGFPNLSIFLLIFTDDHNRACSATQPGFATVTQQQAACNMQHAQQRSYLPKSSKWKKGFTCRVDIILPF